MNLLPGTEPFTVAFGEGVTVPASAMTLTSIDATDLAADASSVLHVKAGSTLNTNFDYTGSWMHGYVYIDADQNRQFSFREGDTSQQGTELLSFSFYSDNFNDDSSGYNSLGTAISGNARNILNPPAFTAPEEAGTYRIRFKVDWNSVDPGG